MPKPKTYIVEYLPTHSGEITCANAKQAAMTFADQIAGDAKGVLEYTVQKKQAKWRVTEIVEEEWGKVSRLPTYLK